MGKSFFNYIQPTIVRLSDDESLPESLRGHYLVNLNVVGIAYFVDNYMLIEDGNGGYMYMLTNDAHKIRLSDTGLEGVIDVPRAYIVLTKEFVESQDDFSSWILSSIADNSFFLTGTEKFRPGIDYYINDVLKAYLQEAEPTAFAQNETASLPNYLDEGFNITKYWQEIDAELARYTNFDFFRLKNKIHDLTFSEDELDGLMHTFMSIIADGASLSDEDNMKQSNQVYAAVIDYFLNYETDCALTNIALILNTNISGAMPETSCGCNSKSSETNEQLSCYDAYKQAMLAWLIKMLGDAEFYKDWMWLQDVEGNYYPNTGLIEQLIQLLEDFEEANYDLSFSGKSIYNHYNCGVDNNSATNTANHDIIRKYIQVLKWVLTGCIDNNVNKIKVIGEKFGELLPKLNF